MGCPDVPGVVGGARPLKVTHIIVGLHIGGAELMLLRLCESFNSSGDDEHRVISLTDLGEVGARLRACGVTVDTLGMRGGLGCHANVCKVGSPSSAEQA